MIQYPDFADKRQFIDWLVSNRSVLIAQKKSAIKHADSISYYPQIVNEKGEVTKAEGISQDATKLKVRSIINTTNNTR